MVERAVEWAVWCSIGPVGRVFEEEYDSIQRLKRYKFGWIKSEELFELDILDSKILDEGGEDALCGISRQH